MKLEPRRNGESDVPVKTPQKNGILFPIVVPTATDKKHNDSTNNVSIAEPQSFSMEITDVRFMATRFYYIGIRYGNSVKVMHTAVASLILELVSALYTMNLSNQNGKIMSRKVQYEDFELQPNSRFKSKSSSCYTYIPETGVNKIGPETHHNLPSTFYSAPPS